MGSQFSFKINYIKKNFEHVSIIVALIIKSYRMLKSSLVQKWITHNTVELKNLQIWILSSFYQSFQLPESKKRSPNFFKIDETFKLPCCHLCFFLLANLLHDLVWIMYLPMPRDIIYYTRMFIVLLETQFMSSSSMH